MASAVDLTSLEVAARRLGVSTSDADLPALITAASEALAGWLGYPLYRREGVEETAAGGAQRLFLRAGAVQSVASLVVYGEEWEAGDFKLEGDSGLDGCASLKGVVLSLREAFPFTGRSGGGVSEAPLHREDTGDIALTLTAGWVTPGQVALAAAEYPPRTLVSDMPAAFERGVLLILNAWSADDALHPFATSVSMGGSSIGFGADSIRGGRPSIPMQVTQLLYRFRKPRGGNR